MGHFAGPSWAVAGPKNLADIKKERSVVASLSAWLRPMHCASLGNTQSSEAGAGESSKGHAFVAAVGALSKTKHMVRKLQFKF